MTASAKWGPVALVALPTFAIASLYGFAVLGSTAFKPGFIGLNHIAPGTDWAVFWGAIRAMLDGNLPLLMDGDRFTAFLNDQLRDWLSVPLAYRPWFYPPSFLVLLLPFAPLGFVGSYVAFQLVTAAALVRPGGALVHIVCSLVDAEGADQVAAFLSRHPGWRAEPLTLPLGDPHGDGVRLNPHAHSTDGFFVAKMIAP